MAARLPQCPRCDCTDSLKVFREGRDNAKGIRWAECSGCNEVVLIDPDGEIVHQVVREV